MHFRNGYETRGETERVSPHTSQSSHTYVSCEIFSKTEKPHLFIHPFGKTLIIRSWGIGVFEKYLKVLKTLVLPGARTHVVVGVSVRTELIVISNVDESYSPRLPILSAKNIALLSLLDAPSSTL